MRTLAVQPDAARRLKLAGWIVTIAALGVLAWSRFLPHLNADEIWTLTLLADAWERTAPFRWILPPANGLFPGLPMAAVGFALGLGDVAYFAFYAAAFSILLFIATGVLYRQARLPDAVVWPAAAASTVLICLIDPSRGGLERMLFLAGSHSAVLQIALFCFALVIRSIETARPMPRSLFWLTALTMFSDFITLMQIVLPIAAAMLLIAWERSPLRRLAVQTVVIVVAGTLVGVGAYYALGRSGIFANGPIVTINQSILDAAIIFVRTFPQIVASFGWTYIACAAIGLAIGLAVSIRALLRRRTADELPIVLLTLSALGGWVGPIAAASYYDPALFRQQLSFYVFPIVILVWAAARIARSHAWLLTPITAVVCLALFVQGTMAAWRQTWIINPPFVRLAERLQALPADLTLAPYWNAKPLFVGSDRRLMVCAIVGNGALFNWVTNYGSCTEGLRRWSMQRGFLAIDTHDGSVEALTAQYGAPDREVRMEGRTFLLYGWNTEREARVRTVICGGAGRLKRARPC